MRSPTRACTATTSIQPRVRLAEEQAHLNALPIRATQDSPAISHASVIPFESFQHPLSVYEKSSKGRGLLHRLARRINLEPLAPDLHAPSRESKTMTRAVASAKSYLENEQKRIESIHAAYSRKRTDLQGSPDLKAAWAYLEEKARTTREFLERFDKADGRFERAQSAIYKEVRKKALRKFPGLVQWMETTAEYSAEIKAALHPDHSQPYDTGLLADPEIVTGDFKYDVFEPPYPLQHSELNVGNNFEQDDSFPWADWGTLAQYVRFSHNHSWPELSSGTSKYGYNVVNVGVNYRMPKHGALKVTVVLKALDHEVAFKISDNFGPSDAAVNISHMIFFPVKSGAETRYLHSISLLEERKTSDGDGVSGSIKVVALHTPIIANFTTGHIHEGEDLQITVDSWFRIASSAICMKTQLLTALHLKVEKIYLRVIE